MASVNADPNNHPPSAAAGARPIGRDLAFWIFTLLAVALFAPCVLLPIKQEHDRIRAQRDRLAEQVAELQATVERNDQALQAVQQDPSILEHLAVRELNLPQAGEQRLPVRPQEVPLPPEKDRLGVDQSRGLESLPLISRVPQWLGKPDWASVFCEPPTRLFILAAAACSALAAVLTVVAPRRCR